MTKPDSATIDVPEQSAKAGLMVVPAHDKTKRGLAIFDLVLRVGALVSAVAAAVTMGNSEQTLQFVSQFFQFSAGYDDFPTFQFFLVAMALVSGYLLLSLPLSVVSMVRTHVSGPRMLLLILDIAALTFTTAAASASAAIVYLAHNGNGTTNWRAICFQYGDFCMSVSGSVVSGFVAVVMLAMLCVLSGMSLRRH